MQAEVQAAAQAVQEADYHGNLDPHLLEAVPVVVALLLMLDQAVEADFHVVVSPEYHIPALVQAQAQARVAVRRPRRHNTQTRHLSLSRLHGR